MQKTHNFTEGKIFTPLIRFSLPILFALFLQAMYGAADLLIVGQFGGANADVYVSAVSTGSQIMMTVTFVITSIAMGLTIYVGEMIGAGKRDVAGSIIGSGIFLFGGIALIVTVLMVFCAPALANIMHAPKEAFESTVYGDRGAYGTLNTTERFYISIC